jgi:hypothetical protein
MDAIVSRYFLLLTAGALGACSNGVDLQGDTSGGDGGVTENPGGDAGAGGMSNDAGSVEADGGAAPVVCEGDYYVIDSASDLALSTCTTVTGNLTVLAYAGPRVSFPVLGSVGGYFAIIGNTLLTSLEVPLLASVGGDFVVRANGLLTSLELPVLAWVGGAFLIQDNTALPTCQAAALGAQLTTYSGATISGNDDLGTCP